MFTYALFLSKLNLQNSQDKLTIKNIEDHIPRTFSLIKTLVTFVDLLKGEEKREIKWAVERPLVDDQQILGEGCARRFRTRARQC